MSGLKGVSYQNFKGFAPLPNFAAGYQALCSAPIIIDVARDLGLPANQAVGLSTPLSLQVQLDVFDQGMTYGIPGGPAQGVAEPLELFIIAVNQQYLTVSRSGASQVVQGGLTADDVAQIVAEPIPHEQAHLVEFAGGDMFSTIKDFARNLAPIGRKVYNALGSVAPYADSALRALGAGYTGGKKKGLKHMAM